MSKVGIIKIIAIKDGMATGQLEGRQRKPTFLRMATHNTTPMHIGQRALIKYDPKSPETAAQVLRLFAQEMTHMPFLALVEHRPAGWRATPIQRRWRTQFVVRNPQAATIDPPLLAWMEKSDGHTSQRPLAQIRSVIGAAQGLRALTDISLAEQDIPTDFPTPLPCPSPVAVKRKNLQALPFVTIDPADARDHDDAVYARPTTDGGATIFIAIADVAAYVPPDSALDKVAQERGNSVYMPDRVVPMLPEALSNDQCSLKAQAPRLAMIVQLDVDNNGRTRAQECYRATICVSAQLSYDQADALLTKPHSDKKLGKTMGQLWHAYGLLSKARTQRAPLELNIAEPRLVLDDAQKRIKAIHTPARLEVHRLIEEFMIRANGAVAEILQQHKTPLLYRVHDKPDAESLRLLHGPAQRLHMRLPDITDIRPKHFNALLDKAQGHEEANIIQDLILRCQAQAIYTPKNIGHYGLHLAAYTHFTSPIRRYSDIVVHRALITALNLGPDGLTPSQQQNLAPLGERLSMAERRAWFAERQCQARYCAAWASDYIGQSFEGHITGFQRVGMFVRLRATSVQAFVPMRALGSGYFRFIDEGLAIQNARGLTFRLGAAVEIELRNTNPWRGEIDAILLGGGVHSRPMRPRYKWRRRP